MAKRQNVELFDRLGMQKKKSNSLKSRLQGSTKYTERTSRADKKSIDDLMSRLNKTNNGGK